MRRDFATMIHTELERRSVEYVALRSRLREVEVEVKQARVDLLIILKCAEDSRRSPRVFGTARVL